jgi:uncharacterized protein with von Willebrand factor type A (vWA) domain
MDPRVGDDSGRIAQNIMHFARLLRAAGLPVGTGPILDAIRAITLIGLTRRDDVYWALHSLFVTRGQHVAIFDTAFHLFWRNLNLLERMIGAGLTDAPLEAETPAPPSGARRLADALPSAVPGHDPITGQQVERDRRLTFSADEILAAKDFDQMSQAELASAKQALALMRLDSPWIKSRRMRPWSTGTFIDPRASFRAALKGGGNVLELKRRRAKRRPPALVVLCDISGSMDRYSRMFLHFLHALANDRDRVYAFVFATRLTNISRQLKHRDVDQALDQAGKLVQDWGGGTRIGACLHAFNRDWSRRTLSGGADVILVSDGLDRAAGAELAPEMERLHKSCRRLIWLNPLLRFDGFQPKSSGIRSMLPHVDVFAPIHNLNSMADIAKALCAPSQRLTGHILNDRMIAA